MAQPMYKSLVDRALAEGVTKIKLYFQGGSDNGYLDVGLDFDEENKDKRYWGGNKTVAQLVSDIEDWAWEVYHYSGAGEGNAYGDNIYYDLKTGKASTEQWYMKEVYEDEVDEGEFEVMEGTETVPTTEP